MGPDEGNELDGGGESPGVLSNAIPVAVGVDDVPINLTRKKTKRKSEEVTEDRTENKRQKRELKERKTEKKRRKEWNGDAKVKPEVMENSEPRKKERKREKEVKSTAEERIQSSVSEEGRETQGKRKRKEGKLKKTKSLEGTQDDSLDCIQHDIEAAGKPEGQPTPNQASDLLMAGASRKKKRKRRESSNS